MKILKCLLISLVLAAFTACTDGEAAFVTSPASSEPPSFEAALHENYIIIDVRTLPEFLEGHIDGAILIPHDEIEFLAPELIPDRQSSLMLYCRSGRRSSRAAELLLAMGYTSVYDLGGITFEE